MQAMLLYLLMAVFPSWISSSFLPLETCPTADVFTKYIRSHCRFNWTNRAHMIEKVRDRMAHRQKVFLRFNAPVFYHNSSMSWNQSGSEFDTWVWVAATHEYMLHFPHNFEILSLGTMGIITNNFWNPGGEGKIEGYCSECFLDFQPKTKPRCTLTWTDISEFMSNVTNELKTEWNYVCHQVMLSVSNFTAIPGTQGS